MDEDRERSTDGLSDAGNGIADGAATGKDIYDKVKGLGAEKSAPNLSGIHTGAEGAAASASSGAGATAGASSASAAAAGASGAAATSTGAAAGTAAGATAGTAVAGPVGTAVGAAVGLFIKPIVKMLFALLIMGLILISVFKSLPGVIFRDAEDLLSKEAMIEQYNEVVDPIIKKYRDEILVELRLKMAQDAIITANALAAGYDSHTLYTNIVPTDAEMIAQLRTYASMIISMYEIRTQDWWISPIWLADFLRWIDLLFVDFVTIETDIETVVTVTETSDDPDTEEDESNTIRHIDIYITYTMKDKGIPHFQRIYGLDDKQMEDARYMADNLAELVGGVGSSGELGGNEMEDGVITGGNTHNMIKELLTDRTDSFFGGSPQNPLSSHNGITSVYGYRDYPPDPYHTGIDFSAGKDTPIMATMNGEVLYIGNNPNGFGKHIVLYHGGGITTMYAHMNRYGAVKTGQKVSAGDVIGYVGTTGLSTGNHLHYEYQINGTPHDPNQYHGFY